MNVINVHGEKVKIKEKFGAYLNIIYIIIFTF